MSKLHKALIALRDSERRGESKSGNSVRKGKSRANNVENQSCSEIDNETKLNQSVEFRIKDLQRAGLHPNDEDADLIAQQFRRVKRPIIQAAFESDFPVAENANIVMMASALPGAGKSFCAFALSQSIGLERDIGAVLVDADVLKPGISTSFGLQDNVGLIDYLSDSSVTLDDVLIQTNLNDVVVIPAGRRHAESTELLASRRMQELVSELSRRFRNRAIIFDMPPLLLTSEAQVLADQAGQIVLVIEARVSSQESVIRAVGLLDRQKPINAILNKSRSAVGGGYRGDDYGYYAYPESADKEVASA